MGRYLIKRLLFTIIVLLILSITVFAIIQAPPGDAVDVMVRNMEMQGDIVSEAQIVVLKQMYGLDQSFFVQYRVWISGFFTGNMGTTVGGESVEMLIKSRLGNTLLLSLLALVLTYLIAIPIGIYSATHQYSLGDYIATTFGFIGLATPNFLLGIILLFFFYKWFGLSIGGLQSPEFTGAPFSLPKMLDFINHLWIPIIVIAIGATAGTIRTLRATLLDELGKQYVLTARAKGVPWRKLLYKYPVRLALNPIISGIARQFPYLIAGQTIVAIVLNLPTLGPLIFRALLNQDVRLAASVLLIQCFLAVIGVIIADILLTTVDPRIRLEKGAAR